MEPPELLSDPIPTRHRGHGEMWDRLRRDYLLLAMLSVTLLVNVALMVFLFIRYNSLPDPLPLHFDSAGLPDRIESKNGILTLPAIGLMVFGLNSVLGVLFYRHQRAATVLLMTGALFVEILLWLATLNATGGL